MTTRILFLLLCAAAFAQDRITISGTVVDSRNGAPLAGVRVAIGPVGQRDVDLAVVTTSADGAFAFSVPPADYSLRAQRPGSVRQFYGALEYGGPAGVGLIHKPGKAPETVTFRLFPPAAISGRVTATGGGPAENARVQLLRTVIAGGRRQAMVVRTFYANDRGDFRFAHLPAGTYHLAADGRPWEESISINRSEPRTFPRVYFPSATAARGAAGIVLGEGDEFTANLTLTAAPAFPARLRLTGDVPPRASYMLRTETFDGTMAMLDNGTIYNGEAHLNSVSPGTYEVTVSGEKNGRAYFGSAKVELGRSAEPVSIGMTPIAKVAGDLQCDGKPGVTDGHVMVVLYDHRAAHTVSPSGSGRFELPGVPPGRYTVTTFGESACYFHRVTHGGKPLPDHAVTVAAEDLANLTLEMRADGARLRGRVLQGDKGVPGKRVMLLPASGPIGPSEVRPYVSDSDGSFSFAHIRPGEYRLLSLASWEIEFSDPKVMAPFLEKGIPVTLPPNGDIRADLPLQP